MSPAAPSANLPDRHPATQQAMRRFEGDHLAPHLQPIMTEFRALAHRLLAFCHDGPEFTTALRKLREAKDCAITQAADDHEAAAKVVIGEPKEFSESSG